MSQPVAYLYSLLMTATLQWIFCDKKCGRLTDRDQILRETTTSTTPTTYICSKSFAHTTHFNWSKKNLEVINHVVFYVIFSIQTPTIFFIPNVNFLEWKQHGPQTVFLSNNSDFLAYGMASLVFVSLDINE